jgi:hypothetical protein
MKGMIFTEFLEMVESGYGPETVERIIDASSLSTRGAYTSVGTYDYREMLDLVIALSAATGKPAPALVKEFGKYLFARLAREFPMFFEGVASAFAFLFTVDRHIHAEARKLYPQAELPRFECRALAPAQMEMIYTSSRPFADLAEGMIEGCGAHFRQPMTIERQMLCEGKVNSIRFLLTHLAAGEGDEQG